MINKKNIFLSIYVVFNYLFSQDIGQKLFEERKYDESQKYYESILRQRVGDKAAQYGIGSSAYYQNNIEGALNSFGNILDSEDKELKSKAYYNIARILQDKNEAEKSLSYYRKSLELKPNDIDTKINYELLKNQIRQNKEQKDGKNKENNESKNEGEQQQDGQNEKGQNKNDDQSNDEEDENSNGDNKNNEENNSSGQDQPQKKDESQPEEKNASQQNENKSDELMQAEAILNALKDQEKINQKQKILKTKSFKFDKDW